MPAEAILRNASGTGEGVDLARTDPPRNGRLERRSRCLGAVLIAQDDAEHHNLRHAHGVEHHLQRRAISIVISSDALRSNGVGERGNDRAVVADGGARHVGYEK